MGNVCCNWLNSRFLNPTNSSPCLILQNKIDLSADNYFLSMSEKSSRVDQVESGTVPLNSNEIPSSSTIVTIEEFIVIWLSTTTDEEDRMSLDYLRGIIHSFQVFSLTEEFQTFLVREKDKKLVLILSGMFTENAMSSMHQLSQIVALYILSNDQWNAMQWINQYEKIQGIFTSIEPLCEQLKRRIYPSDKDLLPLEILDSSSTVRQYLIQQFLLFEINYSKELKTDFLRLVRQEYPNELNVIDDFEQNYTSSSVIQWFVRDCFLTYTMKKAFQTENMRLLLYMAFFIQDLHRFITEGKNCYSMIVYRGQGILKNQLQRLQHDGNRFLSFKDFFHMCTDRTIALNDARLARNNPEYLGVLFRIEIPSIGISLREYHEDGYLLSRFSRFRVGEMIEIEEKVWQIDLVSSEKGDQYMEEYFRSIEGTEQHAIWQQLGLYYSDRNQIDQAEDFYKLLLEFNLINQSKQLAFLYEQLAILSQRKDRSIDALLYYQKSLNNSLTFLPPTDPLLFHKYLQIGILSHQQHNTNEAIQYFKCALKISLRSSSFDPLQTSNLYEYIGDVYDDAEMFLDAIGNYQSALETQLHHCSSPCASIAKIYEKIGQIFYRLEDFTRAFSYFAKTLQIQKKFLSPNHADLADTNYRLALSLDGLQQYKEAIEYASRALNIARHALGFNHDYTRTYGDYLDQLRKKTSIGVIPNGAVYG